VIGYASRLNDLRRSLEIALFHINANHYKPGILALLNLLVGFGILVFLAPSPAHGGDLPETTGNTPTSEHQLNGVSLEQILRICPECEGRTIVVEHASHGTLYIQCGKFIAVQTPDFALPATCQYNEQAVDTSVASRRPPSPWSPAMPSSRDGYGDFLEPDGLLQVPPQTANKPWQEMSPEELQHEFWVGYAKTHELVIEGISIWKIYTRYPECSGILPEIRIAESGVVYGRCGEWTFAQNREITEISPLQRTPLPYEYVPQPLR
jgi:hypothetical protein